MNGDKTFTTQNNLRSSGYVKSLTWLSQIWYDFDPSLISKSFNSCGIDRHTVLEDHKVLVDLENIHSVLEQLQSSSI